MTRKRWFRLRQQILAWGQRLVPKIRPHRRQEVRRILAGTLGLIAVLSVGWAIAMDIEDPPAPLNANILFYALSALAQVAAALAALIGFFGLWRMDWLRREAEQLEPSLEEWVRVQTRGDSQADIIFEYAVASKDKDMDITTHRRKKLVWQARRVTKQRKHNLQWEHDYQGQRMEATVHRFESLQGEQRRLRTVLGRFLLGTLTILVLAIASLAFVDELCAWAWTARLSIILAGVCLGIGPASVIREAL